MAEIHSNGYVSIREHIVQNWKKIEAHNQKKKVGKLLHTQNTFRRL